MFSDLLKAALEREVVGQPRAVNAVVRGVTRVVSGLTPRERTLCAFLFIGPTGTGKTHIVRALSGFLHGNERPTVAVDCGHLAAGNPWSELLAHLGPLFTLPDPHGDPAVRETPPLSVILIEYLERGPREVARALAAALETGEVVLPGGRRGRLRNCLVFVTSSLCAREILDEAPRIGFSPSVEDEDDENDSERNRLYKACAARAEEQFGSDLTARLDGMILFRALQEEHLSEILDRRVQRLNHWLAARSFQCEMLPAARDFLLERGRRDLRLGARNLVRAHRRFVEFPLADLLVSGRIPSGGLVLVDRTHGEDFLHFTVTGQTEVPSGLPHETMFHEVPIVWSEGSPATDVDR